MKLSFVIPCYNEERNIPLIFSRCQEVIKRGDVEVILVDNGSTDGTARMLEELLPRYPFARSVRVSVNQGYGFGILAGLNEAKGEYIGWTHGDLQTPPGDAIRALELIEQNGNPKGIYVKGARRGRPLFDNVFTWVMGVFESVYLRTLLWDINAQPNIFHKSFFAEWKNPPHDFSLDLYALYLAKVMHIRVVRFPVFFPPRIHGSSSWNTGIASKWKFIKRTLSFSVRLKRELARSR